MTAAAALMMAPAAIAFSGVDEAKLDQVLSERSDEMKARYQYRHPKETLAFFGVEPGMTVADVLPGRDWFSSILLPYLGEEGHLIGTDYAHGTWVGYMGNREEAPAFLERRKGWVAEWTERAQEWRGEGDAKISAMAIDNVPAELVGNIDMFMMMRAAHLPNRFDDQLPQLFSNAFKALKSGGVLGIVQHRSPEGNSDAWADGSNGYLKQSDLIAKAQAAGFELVATSEVNANPNDKPSEGDFVWRLPPSLSGPEEKHDEMRAIGESDRMTLKFRKPL